MKKFYLRIENNRKILNNIDNAQIILFIILVQ